MIFFAGKSLALHTVRFVFLSVLFVLYSGVSPVHAERGQLWTNSQLLSFLQYSGSNDLNKALDRASKEDVNQPVVLPFGQGERSLLGLVIELKDDKSLITRLLEKGANPEGVENSVKPPLHAAIEKKKWDIAQLLLAAGASPSQMINDTNSAYYNEKIPLLYVALNDDAFTPFVEIAIDFEPELIVTKSMKDAKSYLELAIERNLSVKAVRYFLTQHGDINKKLNAYGTPYEFFLYRSAARYSHKPSDETLVARQQALFRFFLEQDIKAISPSAKRSHCYDPLYVVRSNRDLLNRLLAKGFDANESNCYQQTHLTIAAQIGDLAVFKALLDAGGILTTKTINQILRGKQSNAILQWIWQNKPTVFQECKVSDCEQYVRHLLTKNKLSEEFLPIVDASLTRLSGKTSSLNKLLKVAISENNTGFADRLITLGADPLDIECNCQQGFWQRNLQENTIKWLVDHQVSPFEGERPFERVIEVASIPAKQLAAVLKQAPEEKRSQKNLHHWFRLLLESLKTSSVKYARLQQQLAVFKTYNVTLNNVVDENGEPYLPSLINTLIGDQRYNEDKDMALIWLLSQGAKPSAGNQSHYLSNSYLRSLMDRAGKQSEPLVMQPENAEQAEALQKLFDDALPNKINMLITSGMLPENQTMQMKTLARLKAEKISNLLYACHYASHQAVWALLQKEIKKADQATELFTACTNSDLNISATMQAPAIAERKAWFKREFTEINFHVLELDSTTKKAALASHKDEKPSVEKSQALSEAEQQALQTLLTEQLKKVTQATAGETQQTLTTLIQAEVSLPDKALQTFVAGTYLMEDDFSTFGKITQQLIAAGADPTAELFDDAGYSLMEYLPLTESGQHFYEELYSELSVLQKIRLWNAYPVRLMASLADRSGRYENRLLLLFLGALFLFAELAAFIALIVYFVKVDRRAVVKKLVPTWRIQSIFWAGIGLLAFAILNLLSNDFFAYQFTEMIIQKDPRLDDKDFKLTVTLFHWSTWVATWSVVVLLQLIALIILFSQTFIQKQYYPISFFTGLLTFSLTLALPLLLLMIADSHRYVTFPFYPLF